jgi:hypothetical protein
MPEKPLDGIEIGALVQQVGGKTVAECMNALALIETGIFFWLGNMRVARQIQSNEFQASDRETATFQDGTCTSKSAVPQADPWKELCNGPFYPCPVQP